MWSNPDNVPRFEEVAFEEEHRLIEAFFADLHNAIIDGLTVTVQLQILQEAFTLFRINCAQEEQLMARDDFPEIAAHRKAHQLLNQRFKWLEQTIRRAPELTSDTLTEITEDLIRHINDCDSQIVAWHQQHGR